MFFRLLFISLAKINKKVSQQEYDNACIDGSYYCNTHRNLSGNQQLLSDAQYSVKQQTDEQTLITDSYIPPDTEDVNIEGLY